MESTEEPKISIEEKGEVDRDISIEIPRGLFEAKYDRVLAQTASKVQLKGFRPGRVPRAMVAKLYGERISSDVLSELISDAYRDAVTTHELKVVGDPQISIDDEDKEKDVQVTASVSVLPEPELKDYKGLEFVIEVEDFDPKAVDEQLEQLLEQHAKQEPISDRSEVKEGDILEVSTKAQVDEVELPRGTAEKTRTEVGSGLLPKEVDEALPGKKIDEPFTVDVVLTEEFGESLTGKTASYEVVVHQIFEKVVPELNEEFIKGLNFDSVSDEKSLRDYLEKHLRDGLERNNKNRREEELFLAISDKNPFELPQALIDLEIRSMLMRMGLLDPNQEQSLRMDVSQFREGLGETAERQARRSIILSKLFELEKVEVSDEDVDTWLNDRSEVSGRPREEVEKVYGLPNNVAQLKETIQGEKIVESLLDSSSIKEIPLKKEASEEQASEEE